VQHRRRSPAVAGTQEIQGSHVAGHEDRTAQKQTLEPYRRSAGGWSPPAVFAPFPVAMRAAAPGGWEQKFRLAGEWRWRRPGCGPCRSGVDTKPKPEIVDSVELSACCPSSAAQGAMPVLARCQYLTGRVQGSVPVCAVAPARYRRHLTACLVSSPDCPRANAHFRNPWSSARSCDVLPDARSLLV
jgi:hypothetical protein